MSIYLAKRCETLDEFKSHKFSSMLELGKYEEYEAMECFEINNGFYGRETLTNIKGYTYENWMVCILQNLDNGIQIQINLSETPQKSEHIEIFNKHGKLTHSLRFAPKDDIFYKPATVFYRPTGLGEGTYYYMDEDFNITNTQTGGGADIHDFDPEFLEKIEAIGEATYKPFMRGGREKYNK